MSVAPNAVAAVLGITTEHKRLGDGPVFFLPQRVCIVAQGSTASTYSTDKRRIFSANEAGSVYGYGSPIHLMARELFPAEGSLVPGIPVTVYPLVDDASGVAATGNATPTGTQTEKKSYRWRFGGKFVSPAFTLDVDDSVSQAVAKGLAAAQGLLHAPVTAADGTTKIDFTAKWEGATGNYITLELIDGDGVSPAVEKGISWALTQPNGGDVNPDVAAALAQVGNVWETMLINQMEFDDVATLNKFQVWGEARWGTLFHRPAVVYTGNTEASVTAAYATSTGRQNDRVNAYCVAPGSPDLPFTVAAAQVARIVVRANTRPGRNYTGIRIPATAITPGKDSEQWDFDKRQAAAENGCSGAEVVDGQLVIKDIFTFWRPTGEEPPAYRYVCDIVKITQGQFNLNLIFAAEEWQGAELIEDDEATVSESAKRPKDAKTAASNMVRDLGLQAILTDTKNTRKLIQAYLSGTNPKRLQVKVPVKVVGNTQVLDVALEWDFNFGELLAA